MSLRIALAAVLAFARAQESGNDTAPAAAPANGGLDDVTILNFALTLEHLESTFYKEGLKNYSDADFTKAGFPSIREKIVGIGADENQHVDFLTSALTAAGAKPVPASTYNFPCTDVKSFLAVAQILEGVGVSAYLGAAPFITNPAYLSAAGGILTVEARHNAFVRYVNGYSPFPTTEDAGISPQSVVTLAAGFFAPGAQNAPAIVPFPSLSVSPATPKNGDQITVTHGNSTSGAQFCAFLSGTSAVFAPFDGKCTVPKESDGISGQTYLFLTNNQTVSDATVIGGPAIVELDQQSGLNAMNAGGRSTSLNGDSGSGSNTDGKSAATSLSPFTLLSLLGVGLAWL